MDTVNLLYESRNKVLTVIDTGQSLSEGLSKENALICPLLTEGQIRINKVIGEGAQGTIYSIDIDSLPNRYALKQSVALTLIHNVPEGIRRDKTAYLQELSSIYNVPFNELLRVNQRLSDPVEEGDIILIPQFIADCKLKTSLVVPYNDGTDNVYRVAKGSYMCSSRVTEAILSLILGDERRIDHTPFFIDAFAFASCDISKRFAERIFYDFTFMEIIDGDLWSLTLKIKIGKEADDLFIQTIYALLFLHERKIIHNDLHIGNIFYKRIGDDTYKGRTWKDATSYVYTVDNLTCVTSPVPFIIKIGDFGLAQRFDTPMILNEDVVMGRWSDQRPNFFLPAYDCLMVINAFIEYLDSPLAQGFIEDVLGLPNLSSITSRDGALRWKRIARDFQQIDAKVVWKYICENIDQISEGDSPMIL